MEPLPWQDLVHDTICCIDCKIAKQAERAGENGRQVDFVGADGKVGDRVGAVIGADNEGIRAAAAGRSLTTGVVDRKL